MKKIVLVLAIFCSVSVSMSYASDIKEQKKEVTKKDVVKIENALSEAVVSVCIKEVDLANSPKPVPNPPEFCANYAWMIVYGLVDGGMDFEHAYAVGQDAYYRCVELEM